MKKNTVKCVLLVFKSSTDTNAWSSIRSRVEEELKNTFRKYGGFDVNIILDMGDFSYLTTKNPVDLVVYVAADNTGVEDSINKVRQTKSSVPILLVVSNDDNGLITKFCLLNKIAGLIVGEHIWNFLGAGAYHLINDEGGRYFVNYPTEFIVLHADDDHNFSSVMFDLFNQGGCNLVHTSNTDAGLVIFQKMFEFIKVLVTDYNFGQNTETGLNFIVEARKISSEFQPMVLTDFSQDVRTNTFETPLETIPIIQKTIDFDPDELLELIRQKMNP